MKIYDIVILGAGASGLMCASHLDKIFSVAMVDINSKIAQKLKISGGGKCNITNVDVNENNYDGDNEFISYALDNFTKDDLLDYLKTNGVEPVIRKERYYFCKDSSGEIINILKRNTQHINMLLNSDILGVEKKDDIFEVKILNGILKAKKLIVATGGKSFKNLGASDIGLQIAKSFNIKVKEFTPALVGLTVQKEQFWMRELSGLSCLVEIKVQERILKEDMLFAHKGISGPCVLSASLYWKKGKISIDFLPDSNILKLSEGSKKLISSVIPLPKRLSKEILKALDVNDIECRKLTKVQKENLAKIHNYEFAPAGNFGFSKAEVCRGGVLSDELNFATFESLQISNLFFIGEVIDVTGELGGYNFQWAFSSGVTCAKAINS